jgi:hypothetical protein
VAKFKYLGTALTDQNIIRRIKSRRMSWAGHVARVGEECVQGFEGKAIRKETT